MIKKDGFSNNADTTLAQAILSDATVIEVADSAAFADFSSGRLLQRATITNDAIPGEYEIVAILTADGVNFTVERGKEGTSARDWPAGSKLQARITAGQLKNFLQMDESGTWRADRDGQRSFVVNGRVANNYNMVQISGVHLLQSLHASAVSGDQGEFQQDMNMSQESVGGTAYLELGNDIPAYAEGGFLSDRSIVKAPTATGFNYLLDLGDYHSSSEYIHTPVASFDASGSPFPAIGPDAGQEVGQWVPIPDPLNIIQNMPSQTSSLVLSEVGFICTRYEATTAPVVSILLRGEDTEHSLVDHVALDAVTKANQVHRIPVASYGGIVSGIRFRVDTPATGKFYGRFYWRGFFFDAGA
ncbi:hypothetical protein [Comamonas sp. 4034]|uniref:hypothetical protein n=1 Tax=Comamonas sp. 4034 TaxID=3156455 RepID=UPI003D246424